MESLGPEINVGVVASDRLDELKLFTWAPDTPLVLADLTRREAAGFGVTNELSAMVPYDVPQSWADELDQTEGVEGIRYRGRFDPGDPGRAVAHFGPAGEAERPTGRGKKIGAALRRRLEQECKIRVAPAPSSTEVTIAAPDW